VFAETIPAGAVDEIELFVEGHLLDDKVGALIR
jgi:hypothetical protein